MTVDARREPLRGARLDPPEPALLPAAAAEELEKLRTENAFFREQQQHAFGYIRQKIDHLLGVIGTAPLRPDELDNETLLATDPIGTVADAFRMVLDHLHRTNDRLRFAHDEIRAIVDSAGAGIMVADRQGRIVMVNSKTAALFDAAPDAILGHPCREAICQLECRPSWCVFDQVLATQAEECRGEWSRDGRFFEVVGRPIRDDQGEIARVVIVYSEISERKRAEEALRHALSAARQARDHVDGILQSVVDGLLVTDAGRQVVLMNPRAEEILGVRLSAPLPLDAVVRDAGLLQAVDEALARGTTAKADFTLPGGESVLEGRISLLQGEEGDGGAGAIVILRDVTQERAIERMKSEFVTTAAHEFRTPLTAIMGFSELMLDAEFREGENGEQFARLIHEKAEALSGIVNNLLDISRIEAGEQISFDRTPCLLADLVSGVLPAFERRSDRHDFAFSVPEQPVLLDIDRGAIEQVFENLLGNAMKYSPDGGPVRIGCTLQDEWCLVSVADRGIGMSGQELARVFDKFYRADGSNTAIRGTGLGMTIVRYIVEAHGGRIWVESVKGEGTTVSFTLPLAAVSGG